MSLQTDLIFIRAINESKDVMSAIGGRLYGTAIPLPDKDADNVPVPYIIVTFDGLTNDPETKDEGFEGEEDTVTVGVLLTASTNEGLHALNDAVRGAIAEFFEGLGEDDPDFGIVPESYLFKAGRIEYDPIKPCYYQELSYECITNK